MKLISKVLILFVLTSFISNSFEASELIKPLFNRYKITLEPKDKNCNKSDFVKTVIILKQRLRDSGVRFKLKATNDLEIKIVFKNESEYKRAKKFIFHNGEISFYVINYLKPPSDIVENILNKNNIEFSQTNTGIFIFNNEEGLREDIDKLLAESQFETNYLWGKALENDDQICLYLIKEKSKISNKHIEKSWVDKSNFTNMPEIHINFNDEGAAFFTKLTEENINNSIAIAINNIVYTAPKVMDKISVGKCLISGNFTRSQAEHLSILLSYGNLPIELEIKPEEKKKN